MLGFNLDRAELPNGPQIQINIELIPAVDPGEMKGNNYQNIDTSAEAGTTYYYWVEWVGIGRPEL